MSLTTTAVSSNYGTLTVSGTLSGYTTTSSTITICTGYTYAGYGYSPYLMGVDVAYSKLSNLDYEIEFSYDVDDHLKNSVSFINHKKITFNCDFVEKDRIQPYELIMKMISEKIKFDITIDVSDILTVKYLDVRFKDIENNFLFNGKCDFSTLQVKIKYKSIIYDNHKLHITEKRKDKLNKIMEL